MNLMIDGLCVVPQPGESLLDILRRMDLDSDTLSKRPLAAQIAGEVFNLNYIPVREQDVTEERISIRRAMAASNGVIHLLRYDDPAGSPSAGSGLRCCMGTAAGRNCPDPETGNMQRLRL